jgi:hypothetical protein
MPIFVLYHRRSSKPEQEWDQVGAYETLEAARHAASEHATTPFTRPQAWIMEQRGANEWRLVADGKAYKVERVTQLDLDQSL